MDKRNFLKPLPIVLAALTTTASGATQGQPPFSPTATPDTESTGATTPNAASSPIQAGETREVKFRHDGQISKFVLEKSKTGRLLAQHYSHSSHDSHASHASHRSHYSGN